MESVVSAIFFGLFIYLIVGILFCLIFLWKGIETVDEDVKGANLAFRLLISPGIALFWPMFLRRWMDKIRSQ